MDVCFSVLDMERRTKKRLPRKRGRKGRAVKKVIDKLEENLVFQLIAAASAVIVPLGAGLAMMAWGGGV